MICRRLPLVGLAFLLLGGCARTDMASYLIDGDKDRSLSLMREAYPWNDRWQLKLVTTNMPKCMRRHALNAAPTADFRLELYRPEEGVFILRQGEHWYVTEFAQCRFQAFAAPPPAPGVRLGEFVERDGALSFTDAAVAAR